MFPPKASRYLAFGLHWQSDFPLDQFPNDPSDNEVPDIFVLASGEPLPRRQEVSRWHNSQICEDGFRFQAPDGVCFDYYHPDRLNVFTGQAGFGASSPYFYGTVVAAIASCRNAIPVHGTTMASGGAAVLLCGPRGAGKSSTAAALSASGFRLISDDLSVFRLSTMGQLVVSAGRTDIRLVPAAAQLLRKALDLPPSGELSAYGKVLMRPPSLAPTEQVLLRSVISLQTGQPEQDQDPGQKLKFLSSNVFRPRLMQRLPGAQMRAELLLKMLGGTQLRPLMTPQRFNDQTAEELAKRIAKFHLS